MIVLVLVALAGAGVFLFGLGSTGLVDETPVLFAASARQMTVSGDWLIPQVNGLPRYDKPPLIYWLIGAFYRLGGLTPWNWDPFGSWAARLPSALASLAMMVGLADTLLRWPQTQTPARSFSATGPDRSLAAPTAALAFALSPLVLVWGRTEVSDAVFTASLGFSLLLAWRSYAADRGAWWPGWLALALAVLCKGPLALVLFVFTHVLFWLLGEDGGRLWQRLRPVAGLALTLLLSLPWYALALLREGKPYWDSFFGYHNLQRFTRVVNNHSQPIWYFFVVLAIASLPFTPLLLLSLRRVLSRARVPQEVRFSLPRFAAAWLLAVLIFFSLASTKLPSYWLVATPAAALLVGVSTSGACRDFYRQTTRSSQRASHQGSEQGLSAAMAIASLLLVLISAALAFSFIWLPLIQDPTLPGLAAALGRSPWMALGSILTLVSALLLAGLLAKRPAMRLLQSQVVLLLLVPLVLLPVWQIGDRLRGAPIRQLASVVKAERSPAETVAMVGLMKPSLHFYSGTTVLYEGRSAAALVNLADRLRSEFRPGLRPSSATQQPTLLLVIDSETANKRHWRSMEGSELAQAGVYHLWRLDRLWLEQRAQLLQKEGVLPNWRNDRPERY